LTASWPRPRKSRCIQQMPHSHTRRIPPSTSKPEEIRVLIRPPQSPRHNPPNPHTPPPRARKTRTIHPPPSTQHSPQPTNAPQTPRKTQHPDRPPRTTLLLGPQSRILLRLLSARGLLSKTARKGTDTATAHHGAMDRAEGQFRAQEIAGEFREDYYEEEY